MSTCRDCGAEIVFRRNARGFYLPINVLGGTHRCQRGKQDHIVGKTISGARYTPSCGCGVPPWEQCACSFAEAAV